MWHKRGSLNLKAYRASTCADVLRNMVQKQFFVDISDIIEDSHITKAVVLPKVPGTQVTAEAARTLGRMQFAKSIEEAMDAFPMREGQKSFSEVQFLLSTLTVLCNTKSGPLDLHPQYILSGVSELFRRVVVPRQELRQSCWG